MFSQNAVAEDWTLASAIKVSESAASNQTVTKEKSNLTKNTSNSVFPPRGFRDVRRQDLTENNEQGTADVRRW